MTKAEIINRIAKETGIDRTTVRVIVEAFINDLKDTMTQGENIYLRGFGTFKVKKKAKKIARNISKNTSIVIPEHYAPAFKPSKSFIKAVADNVKQPVE